MFNRATIIALIQRSACRQPARCQSHARSLSTRSCRSLHPHHHHHSHTHNAAYAGDSISLAQRYTSSTPSAPEFSLADASDTSTSPLVFNRTLKITQRNRVVRYNDFIRYQYLRDYTAHNLLDRLSVLLGIFPNAIDGGCHVGNIMRMMQDKEYNELQGIEHFTQLDSSEMNIRRANEYIANENNMKHKNIAYHTAIADEEW
jgi:hypothetical protein